MTNDPCLTLYAHPLSSYCWKVLLALYETHTPFALVEIQGRPKSDPALSSFWPIGKMPLLFDAARNESVPESSIIIEYLQQHYATKAALIPPSPAASLETRLWDRFFDLHLHSCMQKRVSDRLRPDHEKDPTGVADANATLDTAYAMLEQRMATRKFVAAEHFTMADCAAMPALFYADAIRPFSNAHPALAAYFERLIARPAGRRIIREAQPFFQYFPFQATLDPEFQNPDF